MNVSQLMQALADAGAPFEAILIAVRAVEEREERIAARDAEQDERRAKDAERKRIERASTDSPRTRRGQSKPVPPNDIILTPSEPGLSNDNPPPLADRVVETWNAGPAKAGATPSRTLNAKRRAALKARVREHGEEAVFEAIRNLSGSKFHCGDNDRGWKANIGWLLTSPENFQKALEMEAPPDALPTLTSAERADAAERTADLFERMGRHEEAEERRALAATLRQAA